ncbi:MAG: hypothetical protein MZV63_68355 [Marinilabiliales bacterium]|nr:hypothetical protein [Marinilabiliales bacterium]
MPPGGRPAPKAVMKSAHIRQPGMSSAEISFTFDIPGPGSKKIADLVTKYTVHAGGVVDVSFQLHQD